MHIGGEMLNAVAGVQAVHVPYRGGAKSTGDLIAGRVHFIFDSLGAVNTQVLAGQLRVLAVTTPKRTARLPDLPAMNAARIPSHEAPSGHAGWRFFSPVRLLRRAL